MDFFLQEINGSFFGFAGDKPFSCDICQKKFALSCNLRAHLKTHEAEYQNSATSLELYRRALAALGSVQDVQDADQDQQHSPIGAPESPEELVEEDNEEDADEDESHHGSRSSRRSTPKLNISDYSNRMTVTAVWDNLAK